MRLLYTVLLYLIGPLVLARLLLRGIRQPEYRQRIGERLGLVPPVASPVDVWIHAVSVGETQAALPLIEALIAKHGGDRIWVTTTTPTGSARVKAALGDRVRHSYAPHDWPGSVRRFIRRVQPRKVVVMETELWPNLFAALRRDNIPLTIANARLSPRSFAGYGRVKGFARSTLAHCVVAAQSAADAERFSRLGARRVTVMGNIKFDVALPQTQISEGQALHRELGASRPIWAAVSTHEGEETAALSAHRTVLRHHPQALLILVPRHPQRFDDVWSAIDASELSGFRRSMLPGNSDNQWQGIPQAQVLLGDSMGEMFSYLAAADVVFVGGSLTPIGGHNVLEPAALGLPTLFGPHMHNFEMARALLLDVNAAVQIADDGALAHEVCALLDDPDRRHRMGAAGRDAVAANRGALAKLLNLLEGFESA